MSDGLLNSGLEWSAIDLEEQLSFANKGTLGVVLAEQISAYLSLDGCVDHPVERSDPFAFNGEIPLLDGLYYDVRRRWRDWRCGTLRAIDPNNSSEPEQQNRGASNDTVTPFHRHFSTMGSLVSAPIRLRVAAQPGSFVSARPNSRSRPAMSAL